MTNHTFILIPGAGGDASYWHLVEPLLRQHGHDVVAVSLPAAESSAGIPEYADAVARAIGERKNLVVVGQSLGGFTAALVCLRLPVDLLVFVNAMIPTPGETPSEWWTSTGQTEARREKDLREGRDPDAEFDVLTYFFHDVPQPVIDEAFSKPPPLQSNRPFTSDWTLPSCPNVPLRVITAADDRFFPAEFQRRVAQERLGIAPDMIPGGHLVALSYPKELVDQLEAYLSPEALDQARSVRTRGSSSG